MRFMMRDQTCLRADTHRQRGFTLTELVVALAIIGIMATAFTVTRAMITTSQVGNAVQGVETIAHGAIQYLMTSGKANYAGISMAQLVNLQLVPSGMAASSANPWGGGYQVASIDQDTNFEVTLTNVPASAGERMKSTLSANTTTTYDPGARNFRARYNKG